MTDLLFTPELLQALDAVGLDEVATRLDAPARLVEIWTNGYTLIPERKVVLLIDLLLDVAPSDPLY